jgi:hypothetical protein
MYLVTIANKSKAVSPKRQFASYNILIKPNVLFVYVNGYLKYTDNAYMHRAKNTDRRQERSDVSFVH